MKERPILFTGPMVRAILDGRKTQTRRLFFALVGDRPVYGRGFPTKPTCCAWEGTTDGDGWPLAEPLDGGPTFRIPCPHGAPGDRLWVRETWAGDDCCGFVYRADHPNADLKRGDLDDGEQSIRRWRSARFMPRRVSRITLEILSVRAERLQDISEDDARAEGVERIREYDAEDRAIDPYSTEHYGYAPPLSSYARSFQILWDEINGKRAPWSSNPWVWAITFKRVTP